MSKKKRVITVDSLADVIKVTGGQMLTDAVIMLALKAQGYADVKIKSGEIVSLVWKNTIKV